MVKAMLSLILLGVAVGLASAGTDKVVCYWGTWSVYRWGIGKFEVQDIDPTLCTHLIYGFVGIQPDGNVRLLDSYLDIDRKYFQEFNNLRKINPSLKTLIAIGGWNEGSENYSAVSSDPAKRARFIASALSVCLTHGFDGFDLDWEYPNQRGGLAYDVQNYVTLLKEFRAAFDPHGLLLTAAVAAAGPSVDLSYDVPQLSKYLHFINVMTYDLHGAWEDFTGQNAPLYASSSETTYNERLLNVDASIRGWIERGADPQKLNLGMGLYGRTFTLANANSNQLGASVIGGGLAGKYTGESGFVGYHELLELQSQGGWTTVWDDEQKVPYTTKGNQWIGYDNPQSLTIKTEYAKSLNLGGVMVWSIDTDDHTGQSGTKYQLLRAINAALNNGVVQPEPEPQPNPEPEPETPVEEIPDPEPETPQEEEETQPEPEPELETEQPSGGEPVCTSQGYFRHPSDCSKFYYCQPSGSGWKIINQQCAGGLLYDATKKVCNYATSVDC